MRNGILNLGFAFLEKKVPLEVQLANPKICRSWGTQISEFGSEYGQFRSFRFRSRGLLEVLPLSDESHMTWASLRALGCPVSLFDHSLTHFSVASLTYVLVS